MRPQARTFDVLCRIVASPSAETVVDLDVHQLDAVVELAAHHRVTGSVVVALRNAGRELPEPLVRLDQEVVVNHLLSLAAMDRAGRALDAAGIRWAVVKGPAIVPFWAHAPSARSYHDLDLLVDPEVLRDAVHALQSVGFDHRNHNWDGFRALGVGEIPLDDGEVVLDLHWSLLGLAEQRQAVHLPTGPLLDRAAPVRLGGVEAQTLDVADALVHVGVHHALAGARTLVQLMDVRLLWDAADRTTARARLRAAGATRLVAAVLDRARRVFEPGSAPATSSSIADGTPSDLVWVGLNRAVDRAWQVTHESAPTPFPGGLIGAGRADAGASARALWTSLDTWARSRLGARTVVSEDGQLDWTVEAGGVESYERFLDDVASGRFTTGRPLSRR